MTTSFLHSAAGQQPHLLLEAAAYFVGARVYWAGTRKAPRPGSAVDRWLILACAICGAAAGSKALHVLEHLAALLRHGAVGDWLGGKSVLGGLMGGTLGAEAGKAWAGWRQSTGDAWVPAIAIGLVIGRLGCQVSGLWDQTYGTPTALPWGWDYGDGLPRHPVALYEIGLVALAWALVARWRTAPRGARFAAFLCAYCAIRLGLDFLKPPFGATSAHELATAWPVARYAGLSAIQWAALAGMAAYATLLRHRLRSDAGAGADR